MVCVAANAGGTPRSRSGDSRRSCMVGRGLVDALSPASERSTASPKSSLNPLVQNGVRAWRARSLLVTPRRRSQSLSRFWCTTRRKVGTTRQTRTAWCSSMARMVRKWKDVSSSPSAIGRANIHSHCAFYSGIAFTAKMVAPKPAAQGSFFFQKIFGDGDFLASGQLVIPPNSPKPTKSTKDNTFVRTFDFCSWPLCLHIYNTFVGVLCDPRRCQVLCASIQFHHRYWGDVHGSARQVASLCHRCTVR